jgi:hypothetical protein
MFCLVISSLTFYLFETTFLFETAFAEELTSQDSEKKAELVARETLNKDSKSYVDTL